METGRFRESENANYIAGLDEDSSDAGEAFLRPPAFLADLRFPAFLVARLAVFFFAAFFLPAFLAVFFFAAFLPARLVAFFLVELNLTL